MCNHQANAAGLSACPAHVIVKWRQLQFSMSMKQAKLSAIIDDCSFKMPVI